MMPIGQDLIDDLARRRVALFLGSGVSSSAATNDGSRLRSWDDFLKDAATNINDPKKRENILGKILSKKYLEACEVLRRNLGAPEWKSLCDSEYLKMATPSSLHRALVSLDQRIVITTNFDKLYENAWSDINKDIKTYFPIIKTKITRDVFSIFREQRDVIIKIHGGIDNPSEMIFSLRDYSNFAFGNIYYTEFILSVLVNYTVLFVGFSMDDPAVSGALEAYAIKYPELRPHYIFTSSVVDSDDEAILRDFKKLIPIRYSEQNKHAELVDILNEIPEVIKKRRKELTSDLEFI